MAMGRPQERQQVLRIAAQDLPSSSGHPFYEQLNKLLDQAGFYAFCEERCERFCAEEMGRPSIRPGVYFRMLMIGYFEKLDSERPADSAGGGRRTIHRCRGSVSRSTWRRTRRSSTAFSSVWRSTAF